MSPCLVRLWCAVLGALKLASFVALAHSFRCVRSCNRKLVSPVCKFHRRALHFHEQKREKDNVLLKQKMEPSFTTGKKNKTRQQLFLMYILFLLQSFCAREHAHSTWCESAITFLGLSETVSKGVAWRHDWRNFLFLNVVLYLLF